MNSQLGSGRLLIAVYGVFAISALGRAGFQLLTKFQEAPLAYSLSAVSAVVYVLAAISLSVPRWGLVARYAIWFELVGVLAVGVLSYSSPDLFAHSSVWSHFGSGYGFIPLVLPFIGLFWLSRHRATNS